MKYSREEINYKNFEKEQKIEKKNLIRKKPALKKSYQNDPFLSITMKT